MLVIVAAPLNENHNARRTRWKSTPQAKHLMVGSRPWEKTTALKIIPLALVFELLFFFFWGGGVPNHITTAPKNVLVLAFPSFLLGGGGVI